MVQYVWQTPGWCDFRWHSEALLRPLGHVRQAQGRLLGEAIYIGLEMQADVLAEETVTTASIEGERLDRNSVRSSVARRLGLPTAGLPATKRNVDGLVEMLVDATANHEKPLTSERLKGWHASLFPTGYSGMVNILVGDWRQDSKPMHVMSGPIGKEKIHYEAPPSHRIEAEINRFLEWWKSPPENLDGLLRAALAHFWFVSIHPFDDGNGRIARAITDMALAQDERRGNRLYSMSAQISIERDNYYDVLERNQKGDGDVTDWLLWFMGCLERSIQRSEVEVRHVLLKSRFWHRRSGIALNERQQKVVNRLLDVGPDGFEGGLTNRKYRGITKVSRETVKRDIADLLKKGILVKNPGGGRSVSYDLAWTEEDERVIPRT
ncbi:MAG: Fic family protein [Proteobacteria bacterium]|nr:Fic family protein [Pseudomonadota bacterium]